MADILDLEKYRNKRIAERTAAAADDTPDDTEEDLFPNIADVGTLQQIGTMYQEVRKAAQLTQREASQRAGISVQTLSRLERGIGDPATSLPMFLQFAEACGITANFHFRHPGGGTPRDNILSLQLHSPTGSQHD